MIQLHIDLRSPKDAFGSLTVHDSEKNPIFGPRRLMHFLHAAPSSLQTGQSDTLNECNAEPYMVKEIIPMSGASLADIRKYGRYGFIVLEHADDPLNGQLTLHGGDLEADSETAADSLRLSNLDMRELVQVISRYGKHNVNVSVFCDAKLRETATAGRTDFVQKLQVGFRMLPGWVAAAAPFIMGSKAYATCGYESGTTFSSVDFSRLLVGEGGSLLTGYVPNESSGVTIAGGLDLGHQTSQSLLEMGFPKSQIAAWEPYIATSSSTPLIGAGARSALAANPLTLTEPAAWDINRTYYTWIANSVGAAYNAAVKSNGQLVGVTFSTLPTAWQTVLADMYLTYPAFVKTPCFKQLAVGQWSAAIESLRNFKGPIIPVNERAKANGDYLVGKMSNLPS